MEAAQKAQTLLDELVRVQKINEDQYKFLSDVAMSSYNNAADSEESSSEYDSDDESVASFVTEDSEDEYLPPLDEEIFKKEISKVFKLNIVQLAITIISFLVKVV